MVNLDNEIWHWYHNLSECFYHIQITVKYRKSLLSDKVRKSIEDSLVGFKERYAMEISEAGFDQNHIHILCRFLPKHSGGQVIKVIKSITAKRVFEIMSELWGGEFWTDGYYIATISGRGDKRVIERYIRNQGRKQDIKQLKLFSLQ